MSRTQRFPLAFRLLTPLAAALVAAPNGAVESSLAPRDETSSRLVELYVAAVDRRGRSVDGLAAGDFRVVEDGRPQRILRFERVENLPLHLALVLDLSGSMRPHLQQAADVATGIRRYARKPGFAVLPAGGRTEIHEALELALGELEGVAGQRAILLFSDGAASTPRDARALVEYARRGGVTIYTVGFGLPERAEAERALLRELADESGGRALLVDDVDQLEAAYAAVVLEMRSRYLVAYQSDNPDGEGFRTVAVELARQGVEARAPRGYYP